MCLLYYLTFIIQKIDYPNTFKNYKKTSIFLKFYYKRRIQLQYAICILQLGYSKYLLNFNNSVIIP